MQHDASGVDDEVQFRPVLAPQPVGDLGSHGVGLGRVRDRRPIRQAAAQLGQHLANQGDDPLVGVVRRQGTDGGRLQDAVDGGQLAGRVMAHDVAVISRRRNDP